MRGAATEQPTTRRAAETRTGQRTHRTAWHGYLGNGGRRCGLIGHIRSCVLLGAIIASVVPGFAELYSPMGETVGSLARDGQATAVILLRPEASEHERAAAAELQAHLKKMSGADLSIVDEGGDYKGYPAAVGRTRLAAQKGLIERADGLGEEGLLIYADEDGLCLLGGGDLGTYYAVYAFLEEKLGVRWFNPDPLGEIIPTKPTIEVGRMDETQQPDFKMRWIGHGEWALRLRQNVRLPDDSLGLKVFASAHTFRRFIPTAKHFDEHPEWFALVGGKRQQFEGSHRNQLCTSNPEVLNLTVARMRQTLDEDPNLDIITLFPNDGLGFCECDACKALDEDTAYTVEQVNGQWSWIGPEKGRTLSRRMTIFYREVAKQLLESHPDKYMQAGIYSCYLLAPLDKSLRMPDNCLGQLCHGWCHNHAITDPNCEVNAAFKQAMEEWAEVCPNLCFYEYYYKVAALDLPFPIIHSMRQDLPWLRDIGLFGIYTQYKNNYWTIGLNYYVAAKLLWNADLDVDALLEDYYRNMYGAAWEPMRDYWEAYEQAAIASDIHLAAEYADLPKLFPADLIAAQAERIQRAAALADTEEVAERVQRARIVLDYVTVCMDYMAQVMALAEQLTAQRWQMQGADCSTLQPHAERIEAFLAEHKDTNCFGPKMSSYVERFINPANAVNRVLGRISKQAGGLDKRAWLEQSGKQPTTSAAPETFDLWLYANDIDGEDDKPEHELSLRDAAGNYRVVARLVTSAQRAGNRTNKCFVIAGIPADEYLVGGKLQLRLVNLPGDWTDSTIYAHYVMPHLEGADDAQATGLVETNLKWVRAAAAGFLEYGFRGERNNESKPLEATIEVFAFEPVTLPD